MNIDSVNVDSLSNELKSVIGMKDGIVTTKGIEEIYAIASINVNSSNYSTSASFSTIESTVVFIVSSTTGSLSLDINGYTISGTGTLRGFISNLNGVGSDRRYSWSLNIKSNYRIVPPEEITIVFANQNI